MIINHTFTQKDTLAAKHMNGQKSKNVRQLTFSYNYRKTSARTPECTTSCHLKLIWCS